MIPAAALLTRCRISVRGIFGLTELSVWRLGAWAAHRQIDTPDLWCLTLLPIGLSLPFVWASFRSGPAAVAAMREIVRLRNSWGVVVQADFTTTLREQLQAICRRHGAIEGPVQLQWEADRDLLGQRIGRLNGYERAA